ncbi:MAG: family 20 glycosylhydrolase, partial [Actinomycetota bacterium]
MDVLGLPLVPRPKSVVALGGRVVVTARTGDEVELDTARTDLGDEGYELVVGGDGVRGVAANEHGRWNAQRTLGQLWAARAADGSLPAIRVMDAPRFVWRGLMLDVARHFFPVSDVVRLIDEMAEFKLNRLHLHLTDDQGWRVEIPSWPTLTEVGGRSAAYGDPGGWYSLDDYATIVRHAADRFITVVPEIDVPGHTHAALASVAALNAGGVAPPPYHGVGVGFSSLRLGLAATEQFLDDVIGTVAAATPGPFLHIGGDEAHSTDRHDYLEFIDVVQQIVHRHGKVMVGWEETATARLRESAVVQHWLFPETARQAPPGVRFIMSPARHVYLDMRHHADDALGRRWAGAIDVDTAYDWDPTDLGVTADESRIEGVEAPLWTEKVRTFEQVERLCFPRLLAVAEVGWTPRSERSLPDFLARA